MMRVSRDTLADTHACIGSTAPDCEPGGAPLSVPGDGDGDGDADSREQPRRARNAKKSARMAPS
jgi:hypothetical protein